MEMNLYSAFSMCIYIPECAQQIELSGEIGHQHAKAPIARSEVQMETGDEFLNFNLIKNWSPSQERSH